MLGIISESGERAFFSSGTTYSMIVTFCVLVVGFYLLRSFGLFLLAKKSADEKIRKIAYISFIPFVWVFIASKLAGRINLFGSEVKSFTLILTIVFSVGSVALVVANIISYLPIVVYLFEGGNVFIQNSLSYTPSDLYAYVYDSRFVLDSAITPIGYSVGLNSFLDILDNIATILTFIGDLMLIFVYIALFRKYWPLHSTGACLLSVFGFFPIMIFLIRKKEPIDYEKFMRERYQRMYGGFNNYGGYNQNNFNGNNFSNNVNNNDDDPFDGFSNNSNNNNSTSDDPFDEFNGSDKN